MLSSLALLLNFTQPEPLYGIGEAPEPPRAELVAYAQNELAERNRQMVRIERTPITVPAGLFTHYENLKIPAGMLNRAFDTSNHVEEGFHFDPVNLHQLDMEVTEPFLRDRGIKEVIAVGVSDFTGSEDNRLQNILAGLEPYDGLIIPRGQTFSFNEHLGEVDEANGFTWAKTILGGEDRWGLGGGVCQVSTNIFRAALNAGLPISERRAHSYHLSKYSPAGLDATIYKGIQDLEFTNDSLGDILIRVVRRENHLAVFFFGTRDRQVALEKTSQWQGYDGRLATHWGRTVKRGPVTLNDNFESHYRGSY